MRRKGLHKALTGIILCARVPTLLLMSTTIRDVADEAKVSVATVSRVLNDSGNVQEATRDRVIEAVHTLDYHPSETARSLRAQKTRTVGILLPNIHGEFFAQVTRGLDRRAQKDGHHLLVSNSHTDESEAESVIRSILGRVDGLIILWPRIAVDFLESIVPEELPVVLLNTSADGSRFTSLSFDNREGAYAAVEHLADHGHERIAIFTGGPENFDAQERLAGYRKAIADFELVADSSLEIKGDFTREEGQALVGKKFLSLDPRPTALLASNDSMAIGALRGLLQAGLQVPEDVALVGFDDIPTAKYVTPSLTTVKAPTQELGERAMELLLKHLQEEEVPSHRTLETELILRESCGCSLAD